jgi:hypothetical protein
MSRKPYDPVKARKDRERRKAAEQRDREYRERSERHHAWLQTDEGRLATLRKRLRTTGGGGTDDYLRWKLDQLRVRR